MTIKLKIAALFIPLMFLIAAGCRPSVDSDDKGVKNATKSTELNPESFYQTKAKWDNQNGDTLRLITLAGKTPVISMVFTRCTFACPRIVADMKAIEAKIPADKKDQVVFVLFSFDSDRDHTEYLKEFVKTMKLSNKWMVLHGGEEDVRELSMLLNVKYKKTLNGDFTHSSGISLLDKEGVLVTQSEGLGNDPQKFIDAIMLL